jgi:hypothetical protein
VVLNQEQSKPQKNGEMSFLLSISPRTNKSQHNIATTAALKKQREAHVMCQSSAASKCVLRSGPRASRLRPVGPANPNPER